MTFTKEHLFEADFGGRFIKSPLEELDTCTELGDEKFDMVWSWGVIHHCENFNKSFINVANRVKDGGVIYLYLYGRGSLDYDQDIQLFKNRIIYNTLETKEEKMKFLLEKAKSTDEFKIHQMHDQYAPLINRRFDNKDIADRLESLGFTNVEETIVSGEVRLKAIKGNTNLDVKNSFLPRPNLAKNWFQHHDR